MVAASNQLPRAVLLLVAGCAPAARSELPSLAEPSATAAVSAGPAAPAAQPAADEPDAGGVRGTFRGQSFQSKVGLARRDAKDTAGMFSVWVFGAEATCENLGDPMANSAITVRKLPADTRFLSARVPWQTGAKLEVADYNAGLHYVDADGNELGGGAQSGVIEVIEAATDPGAKAKVRVAVKGKDSDLSGTVELTVCP